MKFIEIQFSKIKAEIEAFVRSEYGKASILFTNASPYGQILSVIQNLHQLSFLYLKNAISSFDITSNPYNERIVRNTAIFAGHIPGRSISSTGTLKLTLKPSVDLEKEIYGSKITIPNRIQIKNKTNGLDYAVNIGVERITQILTPNKSFFLPIIQGTWMEVTSTGFDEELQSIQIPLNTGQDVENFNVVVEVNGVQWMVKKHLYDMYPDENACVVRSGFNGGIDVVFGNGSFGAIPPVGSIISIRYLLSDGIRGNIFRRTPNDWTFIGSAFDGAGITVDMEKLFNIEIYNDINFGADKESISFTQNMLPMVSSNSVLALPQHFAYEIKKLGVFSHVNAYEMQETIFVSATPNVNLFKNQKDDYFTVSTNAFQLDNYEKSKIKKYLQSGGLIQLTKKMQITSPKLSYYIMNVFVISYSDANDDSVNSQILQRISNYFLALSRIDRIPKLDIIKQLSLITDIHSVDVQFICKKNEDYHLTQRAKQMALPAGQVIQGYDPTSTTGLDPILGDILFTPDELPIIRGGWMDRNDIRYSEDMSSSGPKSVNIYKRGTVDAKNRFTY
jgi:hypothetical protein